MTAFLAKFGGLVLGILNGFDRLVFRGTLRNLASKDGLRHYLWKTRVLHKDFARHSQEVTRQLEEASLRHARELGREIKYLNSSQLSTEEQAKQIAARDGIREGLICVLRRVDPCMSFEIHGNRTTKRLAITYRPRQCLHLYHYQIHPLFGFMHARIQTWFPFHVHVCINGHDWLARQMDQAGLGYQRRDNCFTALEDQARARELFTQQLQAHWPTLLNDLAASLNPMHNTMFARYPTQYYWSVAQSEWSSDVLFRTRADLQGLYPRLVRHAITTYGAADVLRFLGHKLTAAGHLPAGFSGAVESNVKEREEGVRLKHGLNRNTLKLYDKGSVLRSECTTYNPQDFRVFRPKEGEPDGAKAWRPLRYGVADMHRRAAVCQAANERYLAALAAVPDTTPLSALVEPLCRRVVAPRPAAPPLAERGAASGRPGGGGDAVGGGRRQHGTSGQPARGRRNECGTPGDGGGHQAGAPASAAGAESVGGGRRAAAGGRQPSGIPDQWAAQPRYPAAAVSDGSEQPDRGAPAVVGHQSEVALAPRPWLTPQSTQDASVSGQCERSHGHHRTTGGKGCQRRFPDHARRLRICAGDEDLKC
jgi:hypothetical protein